MALTKKELELIYEIKATLAILSDRQEKHLESQDRIKIDVKRLNTTIYENGLNTRVKEMHEWMSQQLQKVDNQERAEIETENEIKVLGFKVTAERKSQIIMGVITGLFTLSGIVISTLISK